MSCSATRERLFGAGEHLPGALQESILDHHETAWKCADIALDAADVSIEHDALDTRSLERRLGPRQMDEVVAAQQFPHGLGILY